MRFLFAYSLLCLRLLSSWIRTLPSLSRGGLWKRRFRLFAARERWSLRLQIQASTAAFLLSPRLRGGWRPIIDLSTLNLSVDQTPFRMETSQTVLRSVRRNDWMVSIDLKDAYLQIPIHPAARRYLRFTARGRTWQFSVLCFGLSTAPQVFTRVIAPVSGFLHQLGIQMLLYLDDWLILASSQEEACWARDKVLSLCQELGSVVNLEKSTNSISGHYLFGNQDRLADFPDFGDSLKDRKVLLNSKRISVLKGAVCKVLEGLAGPPRLSVSPCSKRPASNESFTIGSKSGLGLSGRGYPGSLGSSFSGQPSVVVHRGSSQRGDLLSPTLSRPNILVRRLQPRLGGHSRRPVCFRGLVGGRGLSLDQPSQVVGRREGPQGSLFLSRRLGCHSFLRQHDRGGVSEKARGDFVSDPKRGSPAHSALGGTVEHDPDVSVCSWQEQRGGGRPVSPQSSSRLGVDDPSGSVQLAPPALAGDNRPVCILTQSPLFCLFCACVGSHGCGYRCHAPVMGFSTGICLPSIRHDQSGLGEDEGLPGPGAHAHSSILASASVVSGAADSAPSSSSISVGSSASATHQKNPPKPVHASSSSVETLRRFARASGFSRYVARRLGQARRQSSVANYQSKWFTYHRWCTDKGHSVSQPSISKVADYLVWLWEDQGLSLSSVKAHLSMLSSVFRFKLPLLGKDRVLQDLLRSFAIERPCRPQAPPSWDLDAVLRHLMSSAFETLESVSLRALTKKTLFLVSCNS